MWLVTGRPSSTVAAIRDALVGAVTCQEVDWSQALSRARYSAGLVASFVTADETAFTALAQLRKRASHTPIVAVVPSGVEDLWNLPSLPADHLLAADDLGSLARRVCQIGPAAPRNMLIHRVRVSGLPDAIRRPILCGLGAYPPFKHADELAVGAFMSASTLRRAFATYARGMRALEFVELNRLERAFELHISNKRWNHVAVTLRTSERTLRHLRLQFGLRDADPRLAIESILMRIAGAVGLET